MRVVRISPGWIETEAAIRLTEGIAKDADVNREGTKAISCRRWAAFPLAALATGLGREPSPSSPPTALRASLGRNIDGGRIPTV